MTRRLAQTAALLPALVAAAACTSTPKQVPIAYLEGTPLDRNAVGVRESSRVLEIRVPADQTQLTNADRAKAQAFMLEYKKTGSGRLLMSLPSGGVNAQAAIRLMAELRSLGYDIGIDYEGMNGGNYSAGGSYDAPIILAFRSYEAVAPDCPSLATLDLSDVRSNNEMPNLGCAVRANLAAMIAEPSDLLGERELGEADAGRRETQMQAYREGQPTGAERSSSESGRVSSVGGGGGGG